MYNTKVLFVHCSMDGAPLLQGVIFKELRLEGLKMLKA